MSKATKQFRISKSETRAGIGRTARGQGWGRVIIPNIPYTFNKSILTWLIAAYHNIIG